MTFKRRSWILIAAVAILCGIAIFSASWYRAHSRSSLAGLLRRLPAEGAVVLYVDFHALRQSGVMELLSDSKMGEEPEYRAFVEQTGFEYKQDLDMALVAFQPKGVFLLARGRFAWDNLSAYARKHGGECRGEMCRMPGSTPERKISFFPLGSELMALAVSPEEWAARQLETVRAAAAVPSPTRPVWLYVPGSALRKPEEFPAGTQLFVKAMQSAESITFGIGPEGQRLEATLEAICRSERDAEVLHNQLEGITSLLKAIIASEKQQPNPKDLSSVLTAGVFTREDKRVLGRWPLERALLQSLAGSS